MRYWYSARALRRLTIHNAWLRVRFHVEFLLADSWRLTSEAIAVVAIGWLVASVVCPVIARVF